MLAMLILVMYDARSCVDKLLISLDLACKEKNANFPQVHS